MPVKFYAVRRYILDIAYFIIIIAGIFSLIALAFLPNLSNKMVNILTETYGASLILIVIFVLLGGNLIWHNIKKIIN